MNILIIFLAAILLAGLLYFENRENRKGMVPTKAALSSLFILALVVQPHPIYQYYSFILVGFLFCLGGDIFLALSQQRMFRFGLISFLSGHIFYIFAFSYVGGPDPWAWAGSFIFLFISLWIFLWLKPHLGSMHLPVLIYVIVITVMICGALTVFFDPSLPLPGRMMVFIGALCFYFSDVLVARDRFLKKEFLNRLIGLPMYYAGQFLLAFSVGFLGKII